MRRFGVRLGVLLIVALAAAGCGSDGSDRSGPNDPDSGPSPGPGDLATTTSTFNASSSDETPAGVRMTTVSLVDRSRTTRATAGAREQPDRTLETDLYEPDGAGPFPLIVFAHGLNGHPRKFSTLFNAWAEAGYVVAAPAFPVSNDLAPGGGDFIDLEDQPGDLSFVLDRLLAPDTPLTVPVDPDRIGAGGLSLGGATVYGLVYDDCCRDDRVTAAMVLDGNELAFTIDLTSGPPLLLIHADPDPSLPYDNAVQNYASATVASSFLTLHETAHAEPYENEADPADAVVEAVTTSWWDTHLADDPGALTSAEAAISAAGSLASWQTRPGRPN